MLVTELIRRGALWHGDRIAILFGDSAMSFRQVDRLSNRIAHVYAGFGLAKGDPLALLLDNGLHSVPCDFGGVKAGLRRTPLNGRLSCDEHLQMLALAGIETLVYGASQLERAAEGEVSRVKGVAIFIAQVELANQLVYLNSDDLV